MVSVFNTKLYTFRLSRLQTIHLDQNFIFFSPPGDSTTCYYGLIMVDVYGFFKIQMKPRRVVKNRKMKLHGSGFFLISKSTFESGSYSVSGTLEDFFEERQLYWKAKRLRWVKRFQVGFLPFKICRGRRLGRIKSCRLILVNWVN